MPTRKQRRAAGDFKPAERTHQGSQWDVAGGLHSAEIRMLRNGLKLSLQAAQAWKAQANAMQDRKQWEVDQAQNEINALIDLDRRLMRELVPHT